MCRLMLHIRHLTTYQGRSVSKTELAHDLRRDMPGVPDAILNEFLNKVTGEPRFSLIDNPIERDFHGMLDFDDVIMAATEASREEVRKIYDAVMALPSTDETYLINVQHEVALSLESISPSGLVQPDNSDTDSIEELGLYIGIGTPVRVIRILREAKQRLALDPQQMVRLNRFIGQNGRVISQCDNDMATEVRFDSQTHWFYPGELKILKESESIKK